MPRGLGLNFFSLVFLTDFEFTGDLPEDIPEMSDDEENLEATVHGQESFEGSGSMLSSNISVPMSGSEEKQAAKR